MSQQSSDKSNEHRDQLAKWAALHGLTPVSGEVVDAFALAMGDNQYGVEETWDAFCWFRNGFNSAGAKTPSSTAFAPQVCETTLTMRYPVECNCGAIGSGIGPCAHWERGANPERCPYCDHTEACHHKVAAWLEASVKRQDDPKNPTATATRSAIGRAPKWLVQAGGERYDTWLCATREDVRKAFCEALFGDVESATAAEIDGYMEEFDRSGAEQESKHPSQTWRFEDGWLGFITLSPAHDDIVQGMGNVAYKVKDAQAKSILDVLRNRNKANG